MLKVLIVQGGEYHPFASCARILKGIYEEGGLAQCDIADRDTAFDGDLSKYDVVAIYAAGGKLTPKQEKNICDFVSGGKGLVGIHSATTSFKENAEYIKMIGSRFVGHGPGTPSFNVQVSKKDHPLAVRLKNFDITDELYILEQKDENLDVFMTAYSQGVWHPMAYTKSWGRGRVFYMANGHDERAFRNPNFRLLAIRGLLYAAGKWRSEGKPIGFGLLGYGGAFHMGRHHGTSMKNVGGIEPVAACDMDPARLKVAAEELPGIKTYSKVEDMVADSRVQGVVVILPHNLHAPMALKAIQAGKHVIVEKPFCLTESEADSMIGAARENGVSLVVYQNRRWDHNYLTAKKLVDGGAIGKVFETQIDFGGYSNPGTWWRSDKKTSGGPLYDWGAHCIDWMLNIVGSKVVGVSGYFQKRVWHMVTNEDHCRVVIRFEGGEVANFCNSSLYAATKPGWIILGTTGGINFPTVFDKEATLATVVDGRLQKAQVACEADDWDAFYRNLADHLQNGVPLICRPEQSARVIGIVETAEKSAAEGRELPFADKYFGK